MISLDSCIAVIDAHPLVAFLSTALILLTLIKAAISAHPSRSTGLPWIGAKSGQPFAVSIAAWQSMAKSKEWLDEAYAKYSQNGKAYLFPDLSGRHEIVIPNNQLRWLTDKPDGVASVAKAHYELLQGDYAFVDSYLLKTLFHEHVLHRNIARQLESIIPDLQDEVEASIDESWGTETTTPKNLTLWDNVLWLISRASNRMFVGSPLCKDPGFLRNNSAFAMDVVITISLLPLFPKILHPLLGRILNLPAHYHGYRIRKYVLPVIKQRIIDMNAKAADPGAKVSIPEDYITWHIRAAKAEGRLEHLNPDFIARHITPIEFAAIHTTGLTLTMLLLDLFSSDPTKHFVEGIREECERLHLECNGRWDKQTLSKMYRTDSAIRESMRISNFITRGLHRKVLAKDGLKNDAEGWTAPEGSFICLDISSRQHDPSIYPEPHTYDAFRFSRPREEYEADLLAGRTDKKEYLKMQNLTMISTGENFLVFGHGRHACPGRFFVQQEIKVMLAYIVMNYEVDMLPQRPPNQWLGYSVVPPAKAQLRIRRKTGTA